MNSKSKTLITTISIAVGLAHFVIGPSYSGPLRHFMGGYLIDIILPMVLFLLFQIPLRKYFSVTRSRLLSGSGVLLIGTTVELLQYFQVPVFGSTFDPLDFIMYALGVLMGFIIDFIIINRLENT